MAPSKKIVDDFGGSVLREAQRQRKEPVEQDNEIQLSHKHIFLAVSITKNLRRNQSAAYLPMGGSRRK